MAGTDGRWQGGVGPLKQITLSPDGRYIAYVIYDDLYLSPLPGLAEPVLIGDASNTVPVVRISREGGIDPHWEQGGKVLSWSFGNRFYRMAPEKALAMAVRVASGSAIPNRADSVMPGVVSTSGVVPDQTVTLRLAVLRHYAHGTIALRGARVVTMRGDEVLEHATVMVTDGRFTAVGPTATVRIPPGVTVLDMRGKTIIPGLVDLHAHVRSPADVFVQQWWPYLADLAYGVTTARDPSTNNDSFGYAELLETGQTIGPRLFTSGPAVVRGFSESINSLDDARAVVRKRVALGGVLIKQYLQPTRRQRQWMLMASRESGANMTNEGTSQELQYDLSLVMDGSTGVEHNPVWGNAYGDVKCFFAASHTWLTPTLQVSYGYDSRFHSGDLYFYDKYRMHDDPKLRRFLPHDVIDAKTRRGRVQRAADHPDFLEAAAAAADILKLGGHVTLGAHGEYQGIGSHFELWALKMGGLTNLQALRAATLLGAEGIGIGEDLGSIEVGKLADLIVLDKNPLDNIENSLAIRYVMKNGELFDGQTLDTRWPAAKRLPRWLYQDYGPPVKRAR